MIMKNIRINFVDFWSDFVKTDNYFYNILKKYYRVEISDHPDYVFCSYFSQKHFKYFNCVKILYLGENVIPDFNLYDYALGFHNINFEDRYLRLPHYALYDKDIGPALKKHTHSDEYYLSKKKFCNRVVSNPDASGEREAMFNALNAFMKVDSGGRYGNNVGGPVKDKLAFERDYRFTLAYENSSTPGYVTEKILQAFAGDTVPIYWGDPGIESEFNPASFINCMKYGSIKEAVEAVKEVWEDDSKYLAMMKAPMVLPGSIGDACLKEDYADAFLRNIFDQDLNVAKRRNMVYSGKIYQEKLYSASKARAAMDVVARPVHLIKKIGKQKSKKK